MARKNKIKEEGLAERDYLQPLRNSETSIEVVASLYIPCNEGTDLITSHSHKPHSMSASSFECPSNLATLPVPLILQSPINL